MRPRKNARKPKRQEQASYIDPPRFQSVTNLTRTYRFSCNTAFSGSVTANDLISVAGGVVSVANTTLAPIAVSFKLHYVRVWAVPGTLAAASLVSIRWNTESVVPCREDSNTAMTTARPAYLQSVPPRGSFGWLPQGPGTSGVFGMVAPNGAIIEIHATHWFYDTGAAPVGTFTITVATAVGIMQYGYLDQTSTKSLQPVGLPPAT